MGSVVALTAQVGGARLTDGLYRLRGRSLTAIVNTGDDYEHLGLAFSPDLDTLLYTLGGLASESAGWEPHGESRVVQTMLRHLGGPDRPLLGDKALALALLRTEGLASGLRLTEITRDFCRRLGIDARVLPMSDDRVRTHVLTSQGEVTFHDYFSTLGCAPAVRSFQYAGASEARLSDEVLEALHARDLELIVLAPCNPYHGIRPILEVKGMRQLLLERGVPIIAVTPIVGGKALRGTTGKIMRELGRDPSARAVAAEYLRFIDGFIIDEEDIAFAETVRSLGLYVMAANTVMQHREHRVALARTVLEFADAIRQRWEEEARPKWSLV